MSTEFKQEVDETTNSQAQVNESNNDIEVGVEPQQVEGDDLNNNPNIDYKLELERIKQERDNYKQGMLNAKKELKQGRGNNDQEGDSDLENRILNKISSLLEDNQQKVQVQSSVENMVNQLTSDVNEQELIKYHYNNTVNRSGVTAEAIKADLENAWVLANKRKLEIQNKELRETLKAKNTLNVNRSTPGQKVKENNVQLSLKEENMLKKLGVYEEFKKKFN